MEDEKDNTSKKPKGAPLTDTTLLHCHCLSLFTHFCALLTPLCLNVAVRSDSDFQQQRLKAWQPLLTPPYIIGTFLLVGIIFCIIGALIITTTSHVTEIQYRYDNLPAAADNSTAAAAATCDYAASANPTRSCFRVNITDDMSPPIYVYYKLTNFYQNHRRYVKSRSDSELQGVSSPTTVTCDPLETNAESKTYYPCGLIAASTFNDTITAQHCSPSGQSCRSLSNSTTADPANPSWRKQGIAWPSDVKNKFKYPSTPYDPNHYTNISADGHPLPSVVDEDFIVWMRTSGLPTFKKLYRVMDDVVLASGDVLVVATSDTYRTEGYGGEKWVVLSETSWMGGRNEFLGWAYVAVGIACVVVAMIFLVKHLVRPRKLGDLQALEASRKARAG